MELGGNAQWYVTAAVSRGIASVQKQIDDAESVIASLPQDAPMRGTMIDSMEGMIAYHRQMLREMKQYIPEELQSF
jgi:hypothetical protein